MPCRFLPPTFLLALACLVLPAAADPAPPLPHFSNLRSDIIYTHKGEFVQVSPMRPLTLNAYVEQFAYDPLGIEIAYVGSELSGTRITGYIKTLDTRSGREMSRFKAVPLSDSTSSRIALLGWSKSGKSLLLRQFTQDPDDPGLEHSQYLKWDLTADPPKTKVIEPQKGLPSGTEGDAYKESASCLPSPTGRWFMFSLRVRNHTPEGKHAPDSDAYVLYDPEQETLRPLSLPAGASSYSWGDATHLNISQAGLPYQWFDVVSGRTGPPAVSQQPEALLSSKQYPDLSLDIDHQELTDSKRSGGRLGVNLIWIRRTPFGKIPLGIACAGLLPNEAISFSAEPPAVWSPTGKQLAFISGGELCVTNLNAVIEPIPSEKLSVGLKLSCDEERELAQSSLKQVGLGVLQWSQDYDEKFPPPEGIVQTLMPYTKSTDIFAVDGHSFVYEQPGPTLASLDSPATTEMGYMDLPCARVVLYSDGHVKSFPK